MGGDSTFTRIVTGLSTFGVSEAVQKKPFQPHSTIQKDPVGVKGAGTFLGDPAHGAAKAIGRAVTPSSPDTPPPTLGTPIIDLTQTAQDEYLSRQRAIEARQRLGQSTRAKASDQLTGTLG